MISGKSLPSFRPYETHPRAGGFIDGRFMTGIRPQEFFFHCMAGREGLIDTAVKTSRSGYLQRCLIKMLEGLVVNYDLTVRDSDGSVIQFRYGEDSLDITKSTYLKADQLDFLKDNEKSIVDARSVAAAKRYSDTEAVAEAKKRLNKWKAKKKKEELKSGWDSANFSTGASRTRASGFLRFCRKMRNDYEDASEAVDRSTGRSQRDSALVQLWQSLSQAESVPVSPEKWPSLYLARMGDQMRHALP